MPAERRLTQELLRRFESRFVVAHVKDAAVEGTELSRPEFGTGVFEQAPYLEFLRRRRPDLALILEHLPLDHVPSAMRRATALAGAAA